MIASWALSDGLVEILARVLLHFVWQAAALGAIVWGLLHVLQPRRAATRYAIHCGLLALLMLAPWVSLVTLLSHAKMPSSSTRIAATSKPLTLDAGGRPAVSSADAKANEVVAVSHVHGWPTLDAPWVVRLWLLGSSFFAARLILAAVGLWRLTRSTERAPESLDPIVHRLAAQLGFSKLPAVRVSRRISQALATGVVRPMVLLPASWLTVLPSDVLEAVIAHELAHLRRWDLVVNLAQRLAEALFFFHPVVWWCSRRLRLERELACDDAALEVLPSRARYAQALAMVAARELACREPLLATGIGGSKMVLLSRVGNVLAVSSDRRGRWYGVSCAALGAAVASIPWLLVLLAHAAPAGVSENEKIEIARTAPASSPAKPTQPLADVPHEGQKQTLPAYTIEPPDILWIDVPRIAPNRQYRLAPGDELSIEFRSPAHNDVAFQRVQRVVDVHGRVDLDASLGQLAVAGKNSDEVEQAIQTTFAEALEGASVRVAVQKSASLQPIAGEHLVTPDGTVSLGMYGRVTLSGMTLDQARSAIETLLAQVLDAPQAAVSVFAYNSRVYYVIREGFNENGHVWRFPITGNETVLDALAQVHEVGSLEDKAIWIARPAASGSGSDTILPVDFQQITSGVSPVTNYQLFPGDRLFIRTKKGAAKVSSVSSVEESQPLGVEINSNAGIVGQIALDQEHEPGKRPQRSPDDDPRRYFEVKGPIKLPGESCDPPDDEKILACLEKFLSNRGDGQAGGQSVRNVRIVKEKLSEYDDPRRWFPLIGDARLHHAMYKCNVYFTTEASDDEQCERLHVGQQQFHAMKDYRPNAGRTTTR